MRFPSFFFSSFLLVIYTIECDLCLSFAFSFIFVKIVEKKKPKRKKKIVFTRNGRKKRTRDAPHEDVTFFPRRLRPSRVGFFGVIHSRRQGYVAFFSSVEQTAPVFAWKATKIDQ